MDDCDVIVAGAGPAGASAALHLARRGLRVRVFDAQRFPRDKVCGDFLSAVAVAELNAFGVTRTARYRRAYRLDDAAVHLDGEPLVTSAIPSGAHRAAGRVLPRRVLDALLVERAAATGAEVLEEHRVLGFQATAHGVDVRVSCKTGERTERAAVLIAADGSASALARAVRGDASLGDDRLVAVRGYYEGLDEGLESSQRRADLHFSRETFPGYGWVFPCGSDCANVGVGTVLRKSTDSATRLQPLLARLTAPGGVLAARLGGARLRGRVRGWPLTTYNPFLPVSAGPVLLVGDAAGLINPLNGEGIQYALQSGRWAAEALCSAADHGLQLSTASAVYARRVRHELGRDLSIARWLVQALRQQALNPLWLSILQAITARASVDPVYARTAGGLLAGVGSLSTGLSPSLVATTALEVLRRAGAAVSRTPWRAADLARSGVETTQALIDVLSPMVQQRGPTVEWSYDLLREALLIAWPGGSPLPSILSAPAARPTAPEEVT